MIKVPITLMFHENYNTQFAISETFGDSRVNYDMHPAYVLLAQNSQVPRILKQSHRVKHLHGRDLEKDKDGAISNVPHEVSPPI